VPQLFDFIQRAGLTFGRWVKQAPYSPHCGVMARLPHALRMAELSPTEQFAAVELFRGTMVRHSVIVYRDDSPFQPVSFAADEWMSYVPIRMTETICVQERLPAGAAAVLINQKRMFDAIDGHRSIGDLLETTLPSSPGQRQPDARSFFERLWWHDQVVFDTSR
jgi:hypothetical protein